MYRDVRASARVTSARKRDEEEVVGWVFLVRLEILGESGEVGFVKCLSFVLDFGIGFVNKW